MSEKNGPRIPSKGEYVRDVGTLVEVQDVTPKEVVLDYIFEETEARLEGRINGHVVKEFATFNNHYGRDTCVDGAISEARLHQQRLGESNLEFVVVKITTRRRRRPAGRESFRDRKFVDMRLLDHGCCWDLPEDKEEVVWSSLSDRKEPKA